MKTIYIIAGEASGDLLGAGLIRSIKKMSGEAVEFRGVGGDEMIKEGLQPLFHIKELSVMGFAEILPHIPRIFGLLNQTVADVKATKPATVITIDSPAFNIRVVKKLQGLGIPLIHYVAPSVWAYKPHRAAKFAKLYNHLLAVLPFEPPYFEAEGLKTTFVGHTAVTACPPTDSERQEFKKKHNIKGAVLTMLAGSRKGEIRNFLPIYQEVVEIIRTKFPDITILMPTHLKEFLEEATQDWEIKPIITDEKELAFAVSTVALAKSGTISLELAVAGVPMIVTYKANPITVFLVRRMISTPYASIINLVHNKELFQPDTPASIRHRKVLSERDILDDDRMIIPEFIQETCRADILSSALLGLLENPQRRTEQVTKYQQPLKDLGLGTEPSDKAAEVVLGYL